MKKSKKNTARPNARALTDAKISQAIMSMPFDQIYEHKIDENLMIHAARSYVCVYVKNEEDEWKGAILEDPLKIAAFGELLRRLAEGLHANGGAK